MGVDYLGIHLGTLEYIAVLLFGLIIFIVIMIATERGRQRRHHKAMEMHRRKMQHHQQTHDHQSPKSHHPVQSH